MPLLAVWTNERHRRAKRTTNAPQTFTCHIHSGLCQHKRAVNVTLKIYDTTRTSDSGQAKNGDSLNLIKPRKLCATKIVYRQVYRCGDHRARGTAQGFVSLANQRRATGSNVRDKNTLSGCVCVLLYVPLRGVRHSRRYCNVFWLLTVILL